MMETSGGIVFRRPLCYYTGAGTDAHSSSKSKTSSFSSVAVSDPHRFRAIKFSRSAFGFHDCGHMRYYSPSVPPRCRTVVGKKNKEKEKGDNNKKKSKLLKGLTKDLSVFSDMGFGLDPANHGIFDQVKAKMISEAARVLLGQLQQLRAEERESKKRRKKDKSKLNVRPAVLDDCQASSSSSSSESSDVECGEVLDLSHLGREAKANFAAPAIQPSSILFDESLSVTEEITLEGKSSLHSNQNGLEEGPCCGSSISSAADITSSCLVTTKPKLSEMNNKRIEVCMGNKCKKSGSPLLLEEFESRVGDGGAVIGCKCMGKCRDGPNVRVLSGCADLDQSSDSTPRTTLCIGVDLEDVGAIMAKAFGDVGLLALT